MSQILLLVISQPKTSCNALMLVTEMDRYWPPYCGAHFQLRLVAAPSAVT